MTTANDDHGWVSSLASAVVGQARAFVPADVDLLIEGSASSLWIRALAANAPVPDARFAFSDLALGAEDHVEGARIAMVAFLSGLQDWIARNTAKPWPGTGTALPTLHVRTVHSRVDAWFGSEEQQARVSANVV